MANNKHIAYETTSVMFNSGFNFKKKTSEDLFGLVQESMMPVFERIAANAKENLSKNKSVDTSALQSAIATKYKNKTRKKTTWLGVGIDAKKAVVATRTKGKSKTEAAYRVPVHYAHLIEAGFDHVDGKHVGGKPFLAPAVASVGGDEFIVGQLQGITNHFVYNEVFQGEMILGD